MKELEVREQCLEAGQVLSLTTVEGRGGVILLHLEGALRTRGQEECYRGPAKDSASSKVREWQVRGQQKG